MELTQDQAVDRLYKIIADDYTNPHVKRMVNVADFGSDMLNNNGEPYLQKIYQRESAELLKQRNNLHNPLSGMACRIILNPFKKVRRTDGVREVLRHEDSDFQNHLQKVGNDFFGTMDVKEYVHSMAELLNMTDANAFIILNYRNVINVEGSIEYPIVYPVVMPSHQVRDFNKSNGGLDWVVFETKRTIEGRSYSEFFMYHAGFTIHFFEVEEGGGETKEGYTPMTVNSLEYSERYFLTRIIENSSKNVPVFQVGVFPDPKTGNKTFLNIPYLAKPQFIDLLRDKSYDDVLTPMHVFLKEMYYAPVCDECEGSGRMEIKHGDKYEEVVCSGCSGHGTKKPTQQESIRIKLPNDTESMFDLNKLHAYAQLPLETPKHIQEKINETMGRIVRTIFNSDAFTKSDIQVAATATEKILDSEAVNDILDPYGRMISLSIRKIWTTIAEYSEKEKGLEVEYDMPYDKGIETVNQLLAQLKAAKDSGASVSTIQGIESKLQRKMYRNDPDRLKDLQAFQLFIPFEDKSREEIALILTNRDDSDFDKVSWENSDRIIREIKAELTEPFYKLPYEAQKEVWAGKVEQVRQSITTRQVAPAGFPSFGLMDQPGPDDE